MIQYIEKKPSLEEYLFLRNSVDWQLDEKGISQERVEESLNRSPLAICAYENNKIIGMVRLSGDLSMYGYIQDTIVLNEYQGKGVGKNMIKKVFEKLKDKKGYLLGVCPSKVSVNFYSKFGFKRRPESPNGFMSVEI